MGKHIIGLGLLVTCLFAGVSCRYEGNIDFSVESFSKVKDSRYQLTPLRRPRRPRGLFTGLRSGLSRVPIALGERLPLSLGRRVEFHMAPPELPPLSFELRSVSALSFKPRSGSALSFKPRSGLPISLEPRSGLPISLEPQPESPLSAGPRLESPRVPSPKQEPPLAAQESEPSNGQPPSKTRGPQDEDENHEENHRNEHPENGHHDEEHHEDDDHIAHDLAHEIHHILEYINDQNDDKHGHPHHHKNDEHSQCHHKHRAMSTDDEHSHPTHISLNETVPGELEEENVTLSSTSKYIFNVSTSGELEEENVTLSSTKESEERSGKLSPKIVVLGTFLIMGCFAYWKRSAMLKVVRRFKSSDLTAREMQTLERFSSTECLVPEKKEQPAHQFPIY